MLTPEKVWFVWAIIMTYGLDVFAQQPVHYRSSHLDIDQGLSNNQVNDFLRDRQGFLWVATASGLNRFDGYTFTVYSHTEHDSSSLAGNDVVLLGEDPNGRIWVFTNKGLCVFDQATEKFERNLTAIFNVYGLPPGRINGLKHDQFGNYWFIHEQGLFRYNAKLNKTVLINPFPDATISSFGESGNGRLWIAYRNGRFVSVDQQSLRVMYVNNDLFKPNRNERFNIRVDQDGDLWIFANSVNNGVYYFNDETQSVVHIDENSTPLRLNNDIVRDVEVAANGQIWVATDHGGLNIISKPAMTVTYIVNDPKDYQSLSQNSISVLYRDNEGIMWIGTFKKGISYYHEDFNKFFLYQQSLTRKNSLPFNDINCFVEDDKGNIWIGTNGGGLIYFNRKENTFRQYLHRTDNSSSLSNNVIVSLCFDSKKRLWIGTYFGGLDYYDGSGFHHFTHHENDAASIADNSIWDILEDKDHTLWLATLSHGLDHFDPEKKTIEHYGSGNKIYSGHVTSLLMDSDENLWVGTGYGLSVRRKGTNQFEHLGVGRGNTTSLSSYNVLSLFQDSRGLIWIGTQDGLNLYDAKRKTFTAFTEKDGLPDNNIQAILEDDAKKIWITTPKGIAAINLIQQNDSLRLACVRYDESDGLQGKQFNKGAALKTKDGELIFGGVNGFNRVNPSSIKRSTHKPPVVIVDFQIDNKSLKAGAEFNGKVVLEKSITETEVITLRPGDHALTIQFAALSYSHSARNQYRYRLQGFNKDWIETSGSLRSATYTNLNAGEYVFKVIASNSDGFWNEEGATLRIIILPPRWKSPLAFLLYIVFIIGILLVARKLILSRAELKYQIEREREEAQRTHELDLLKIKFFTNVSHEFRTPLTLILTPIESLLKQASSSVVVEKGQLQLIQRNARRLLTFVNQLLDFRRMEVHELKFNPSDGDMVKFAEEVSYSFSDLWEKKNIRFSFTSTVARAETVFDSGKMERVLFNLISNAFKFTPEGGEVSVNLTIIEQQAEPWISIKVKDTGIGISPVNHEKIFERFFQSDLPSSMVNEGSGIGLSITKEFVKLHGGFIILESEPDKGSCFTVTIPQRMMHLHTGDITPSPEVPVEIVEDQLGNPMILLVEDSDDLRFYLKDNLKSNYRIEEAKNGCEGWQKAINQVPDIIVSDLMMPEMDGIELCRNIRKDARTSHIPFILLTSKSSEEQRIQGLRVGVDDYITKPFSFEILQARIKNLIALRKRFHTTFQKNIDVKASEISISSLDEKLIARAIKIVEDHMADADFSVEDFSHELGMSRAHLYRKVLSLTGKAPIEFIRLIRLQRAAQLLEKSQLTVAEIAYEVGFNSPKYFARYFKEQFNELPSVYAANRKAGKGA